MTTLEEHRDYLRAMAQARHRPDCGDHRLGASGWVRTVVRPDPACPGCVSDAERALWARLAAEVDAYLAADDEDALW